MTIAHVTSKRALTPPTGVFRLFGAPAVQSHTQRLRQYHVQPSRRACQAGKNAGRSGACVTSAALTPDAIFATVTLAVMPMYGLMVAAPYHKVTRSVINSTAFLAVFSLLYAWILASWLPQNLLAYVWGSIQGLAAGVLPDVLAFAALFQNADVTALTWLHLLLLDFFQARVIYLDGLKDKLPMAHSLLLCFMCGPLGLVSHCMTKAIVALKAKLRPNVLQLQLAGPQPIPDNAM